MIFMLCGENFPTLRVSDYVRTIIGTLTDVNLGEKKYGCTEVNFQEFA